MEALDFEFIFKCLEEKGYSPRGSMTMAEPYITFIYKGEYYKIVCWGCIGCAIYKTFPINNMYIDAAKDIAAKIMRGNPMVRVIILDDDECNPCFPMNEKLLFTVA